MYFFAKFTYSDKNYATNFNRFIFFQNIRFFYFKIYEAVYKTDGAFVQNGLWKFSIIEFFRQVCSQVDQNFPNFVFKNPKNIKYNLLNIIYIILAKIETYGTAFLHQ